METILLLGWNLESCMTKKQLFMSLVYYFCFFQNPCSCDSSFHAPTSSIFSSHHPKPLSASVPDTSVPPLQRKEVGPRWNVVSVQMHPQSQELQSKRPDSQLSSLQVSSYEWHKQIWTAKIHIWLYRIRDTLIEWLIGKLKENDPWFPNVFTIKSERCDMYRLKYCPLFLAIILKFSQTGQQLSSWT